MYKKILVGIDGSETGSRAFDSALEHAARDNAELFVLSVAQPPDIGGDVETEAVIENSLAYHRKLFPPLQKRAKAKGVKARFETAVGHPVEQIIYHADRHNVDLIVIGDRGRSKFAKLLMGSVSKEVLQHAARPVLLVR